MPGKVWSSEAEPLRKENGLLGFGCLVSAEALLKSFVGFVGSSRILWAFLDLPEMSSEPPLGALSKPLRAVGAPGGSF